MGMLERGGDGEIVVLDNHLRCLIELVGKGIIIVHGVVPD